MVYYSLIPTPQHQGVGFGVPFQWDIPLLEGYDWEVLPNRKKNPNLSGFFSTSNPNIESVLSDSRPDVAILTGWHSLPLLQALRACIKLKIPRIIRGESNSIPRRAKWKKLSHRWLLSHYDAFLAIGKKNHELYASHGISPLRIFRAPYFVDNSRFWSQCEKVYPSRLEIRKEWNIPANFFCFLFAGKLQPKKRCMDLLRALEKAKNFSSNIYLLIVGTGEMLPEAQAFASKKSLPVTFAGFLNQTEITKAYAAADCLVLPSDAGETWGLVVNEAMACGLPAIVSDHVGCAADLIEEGVTGRVFPLGEVDQLARILVDFSFSCEEARQMGQNAKNKVQEYSVEKAVEGTMAAVDFVLKSSATKEVMKV